MAKWQNQRPRSTKGRGNPVNPALGANIKRIRESKRRSLEWMASRLGISVQQLYTNEAGKSRIGGDRLYYMACLLRCSVEDFYDDMPSSTRRGLPRYRRRATPLANDNDEQLSGTARRTLRKAA